MSQLKSFLTQALAILVTLWKGIAQIVGSLVIILIVLIVLLISETDNLNQDSGYAREVIETGSSDEIALIRLRGEIVPVAETSFTAASSYIPANQTIRLLDSLQKNQKVKAVVIEINSPGGAVVASDEIYQKIKELSQEKPVVTYFSDVAASGGYYIAAGSNQIVANPATITGSIGVIAQFPKLQGLYDKLGIEMRVIKSGQYKDMGSEARDMSPEEEAILQNLITDSYDQFIKAIVEGRRMDESMVRSYADGRIYSGKQAQELGLVDALGNLETAITSAEKLANLDGPSVVEYNQDTFWSSLFQSSLGNISLFSQTILPEQSAGLYYLWSE